MTTAEESIKKLLNGFTDTVIEQVIETVNECEIIDIPIIKALAVSLAYNLDYGEYTAVYDVFYRLTKNKEER